MHDGCPGTDGRERTCTAGIRGRRSPASAGSTSRSRWRPPHCRRASPFPAPIAAPAPASPTAAPRGRRPRHRATCRRRHWRPRRRWRAVQPVRGEERLRARPACGVVRVELLRRLARAGKALSAGPVGTVAQPASRATIPATADSARPGSVPSSQCLRHGAGRAPRAPPCTSTASRTPTDGCRPRRAGSSPADRRSSTRRRPPAAR